MSDDLHFPTCRVWETNELTRCNCTPKADWRVLKDETQQFPWRVFRKTKEGHLEEIMGCSSADGAQALVRSLDWLSRNGRQLRGKNG